MLELAFKKIINYILLQNNETFHKFIVDDYEIADFKTLYAEIKLL